MLTPTDFPGLDPSTLRPLGEGLLWEPDGSWRARIEPLLPGSDRLLVAAGPLWVDPLPSKVVRDAGEAVRWVLRRWERDHSQVRVLEEWERTI